MTIFLPNRRDVSRRLSPHDLAAGSTNSLESPFGQPCFPCSNCKKGGAVIDCAHCRSATTQYQFTFKDVSDVVQGTSVGGNQEYTVEWATDCTWESDDLPVVCSGGTDQFGFALEFAGKNPGDVSLTFSRRDGSGCNDVEFTYRNFYPSRCLCPMLMFLDAETVQGVDADDLPCSLCIEPTYQHCEHGSQATCGCPANWRILIDSDVIETTTGPLSSDSIFNQFFCAWWTALPVGGFWYLLLSSSGDGVNRPIVVSKYSSVIPPPPGSPWPFLGDVRVAWWELVVPEPFCPSGCHDGATLTRGPTGSSTETITVEHLNG